MCGGQKSKKPIQREIAPPRRPRRKKEKEGGGLLIFCFFAAAAALIAFSSLVVLSPQIRKKTALYPNFLCCLLPFPFIECIFALVNTPTSTEASLNSKKEQY